MKLKRVSLDETEKGKRAIYRSGCGRVEMMWFCPRDRLKRVSSASLRGDDFELRIDGELVAAETFRFNTLRQMWDRYLDRVDTCYDCGRLAVCFWDENENFSHGRCEEDCAKTYETSLLAMWDGQDASRVWDVCFGLTDILKKADRQDAAKILQRALGINLYPVEWVSDRLPGLLEPLWGIEPFNTCDDPWHAEPRDMSCPTCAGVICPTCGAIRGGVSLLMGEETADRLQAGVANLLRHIERGDIEIEAVGAEGTAKAALCGLGLAVGRVYENKTLAALTELLQDIAEDDADLRSFGPETLASELVSRLDEVAL